MYSKTQQIGNKRSYFKVYTESLNITIQYKSHIDGFQVYWFCFLLVMDIGYVRYQSRSVNMFTLKLSVSKKSKNTNLNTDKLLFDASPQSHGPKKKRNR
jgi:hypothetical protein